MDLAIANDPQLVADSSDQMLVVADLLGQNRVLTSRDFGLWRAIRIVKAQGCYEIHLKHTRRMPP